MPHHTGPIRPVTSAIHPVDDDLVLHYYADPAREPATDAHLRTCSPCAERYRELAAVLEALPPRDVPERDADYGRRVWERIRHDLPARARVASWMRGNRLALAAAAMLLLVVGFSAGRLSQGTPAPEAAGSAASIDRVSVSDGDRRRLLLTVVADHLERSDRLLMDVMNATDDVDISVARQRAEDLLWTGRVYRQDAAAAGEHSIAVMLDDLERTLLDIAHGPARPSAEELEPLRRRVDGAALLFKVRVMRDELRQEDVLPPADVNQSDPRLSQTS